MSYRESAVLYESPTARPSYWVLRGKLHTQVMLAGPVASESIETYPAGADEESLAIARARYLAGRLAARNAVRYLIADLKTLTASYDHGNDWAGPEIQSVSEAINILDRLRGTTAV